MSELINTETGEIISYADAHGSVDRARGHVEGFWSEVKWQVDNRAWEVLGYADFNALWAAEYEGLGVSISRAERPELVGSLRAVGQTQQQIADKLGVSEDTVQRDEAQNRKSGIENPSGVITNSRGQQRPASYRKPDPEPEVVDAEIVDDEDEWKSPSDLLADPPKPAPDRRRSWTDSANEAGLKLDKIVTTITNLSRDDRLPKYKNEAIQLRNDLARAVNALQRVIDQLPHEKSTS